MRDFVINFKFYVALCNIITRNKKFIVTLLVFIFLAKPN